MTEQNTHGCIDSELVGSPLELGPGRAEVELKTTRPMVADERGLVHGGFIFGLADYAAMLAVNDPFVVLGASDVRFTKPVVVGDTVRAVAELAEESGKKRVVNVKVLRADDVVFEGVFTCFVLPAHVLGS